MQLNDRVDSGSGFVVGVADDGDIERFEEALGAEHRAYFQAWRRGRRARRCVIVVARIDDRIVGAGLVRWGRAQEPAVRRMLRGVPQLYHFQVHPDYRRRGIGTALLREAERILIVRGFTSVLLGVDHGNKDARRLYERLDYVMDDRLTSLKDPQHSACRFLFGKRGESYDILVHDLKSSGAQEAPQFARTRQHQRQAWMEGSGKPHSDS